MGVDVGRDEVSAREHYEQAKDSAIAACVDADPSTLRKCVIEAVETAQDQSEARQDLYAQQDMSRWAFWMMVVSALMFLVSGLGVVWIRDTLVETRKAVRAADDAVGVTRDIGEKQVRAYVGLSEIDQASVIEAINAGDGRDIEFGMKNFGQTPARNFRFLAFYNIHPKITDPQEDDFIKAESVERPPNDTLQIGADAAGAARAYIGLTKTTTMPPLIL